MGPAGAAYARVLTGLRYGARGDNAAETARAKIIAALDRLEAELGGGDYLVGESFSVADLTAAALLYPLVRPPEAYVTIDRMPEPVERLRRSRASAATAGSRTRSAATAERRSLPAAPGPKCSRDPRSRFDAASGTLDPDSEFSYGTDTTLPADLHALTRRIAHDVQRVVTTASGRYLDRFERRAGQWRFVERRVRTDLVGDVSRHLRRYAADQ
jgi:hypothetical protein